jgi:uncharacterized membrane protein YoaK (UPF0700 family)
MQTSASALELRPPQRLPVLLSVIAGYIDSCTFLGLFGLFVAQVTGSFVIAGAQLVAHDPGFLIKVLAIPFFLLGGITTTVVVAAAIARGGSANCWAFGLEGFFLLCFLLIGVTATPFHVSGGLPETAAAFFGLAAMGAQSAQVRLLMHGVPSTNVMTTNTTLIAIEATQLVLSWGRTRGDNDGEIVARLNASRGRLLLLVSIALGFFAGTIAGALAYRAFAFWCLLLPTAAMVSLALWVRSDKSLAAA